MQISYAVTQMCMLSQETVAPGAHRRKLVKYRRQLAAYLHGTIRKTFGKGGSGKRNGTRRPRPWTAILYSISSTGWENPQAMHPGRLPHWRGRRHW